MDEKYRFIISSYALACGVFLMGIRWVIHKKDGSTTVSGWNDNSVSFRKAWSKDVTSIQLQRESDKKLFTLSSFSGKSCDFWEVDDFIVRTSGNSNMVSRKIFKRLYGDIWLGLSLSENTNPEIFVIKKRIKVG